MYQIGAPHLVPSCWYSIKMTSWANPCIGLSKIAWSFVKVQSNEPLLLDHDYTMNAFPSLYTELPEFNSFPAIVLYIGPLQNLYFVGKTQGMLAFVQLFGKRKG